MSGLQSDSETWSSCRFHGIPAVGLLKHTYPSAVTTSWVREALEQKSPDLKKE